MQQPNSLQEVRNAIARKIEVIVETEEVMRTAIARLNKDHQQYSVDRLTFEGEMRNAAMLGVGLKYAISFIDAGLAGAFEVSEPSTDDIDRGSLVSALVMIQALCQTTTCVEDYPDALTTVNKLATQTLDKRKNAGAAFQKTFDGDVRENFEKPTHAEISKLGDDNLRRKIMSIMRDDDYCGVRTEEYLQGILQKIDDLLMGNEKCKASGGDAALHKTIPAVDSDGKEKPIEE